MRTALKLAVGWTGTATIATAATVALLQSGDAETAQALSPDEVSQRLATGEAAPKPQQFEGSTEVGSGPPVRLNEAFPTANGTKVVTPRGTVTIGCMPEKSRVPQILARAPKSGMQTDRIAKPGYREALGARLNIPDVMDTRFWSVSVRPKEFFSGQIRPKTPHTLVFNWCENGKPRWRVVNQ